MADTALEAQFLPSKSTGSFSENAYKTPNARLGNEY